MIFCNPLVFRRILRGEFSHPLTFLRTHLSPSPFLRVRRICPGSWYRLVHATTFSSPLSPAPVALTLIRAMIQKA